MNKVGAVIVAAGRGVRAGGGVPKQWRMLGARSVAEHAIRAFSQHPLVDRLVLVVHPDDTENASTTQDLVDAIVTGGATRSASVIAGLRALVGHVDLALIHDAARPCVSQDVITDVVQALQQARGAAPAVAVVDALWTGSDGIVTGVADRSGLYRAQTPQGFRLDDIIAAHETYPDGAADDVEIARRHGLDVVITKGHEDNLKITTPEDFERAKAILRMRDGH